MTAPQFPDVGGPIGGDVIHRGGATAPFIGVLAAGTLSGTSSFQRIADHSCSCSLVLRLQLPVFQENKQVKMQSKRGIITWQIIRKEKRHRKRKTSGEGGGFCPFTAVHVGVKSAGISAASTSTIPDATLSHHHPPRNVLKKLGSSLGRFPATNFTSPLKHVRHRGARAFQKGVWDRTRCMAFLQELNEE